MREEVMVQKNKERAPATRINNLKDLFDLLGSTVFDQSLRDWLAKETRICHLICHLKVVPYYTSVHVLNKTFDIIGDKTLTRLKVTLELEEPEELEGDE